MRHMTREERRLMRREGRKAAAIFSFCILLCLFLPGWAEVLLGR